MEEDDPLWQPLMRAAKRRSCHILGNCHHVKISTAKLHSIMPTLLESFKQQTRRLTTLQSPTSLPGPDLPTRSFQDQRFGHLGQFSLELESGKMQLCCSLFFFPNNTWAWPAQPLYIFHFSFLQLIISFYNVVLSHDSIIRGYSQSFNAN